MLTKGEFMIPLTFATLNESNVVKKIQAEQSVIENLKNLGVVVGSVVTIVSFFGESVIISVKDARVAISKEVAKKVLI